MIVALIVFISAGLIGDALYTLELLVQSVSVMFVYLVVFVIIQRSVHLYLWFNESREIDVDKLKQGMVMDKNEVQELGLWQEISLHPNGLSEEQVARIKGGARQKGRRLVHIYKPFPFALWEFIGVVFTLVTQASVVNWVLLFFRGW